MIPSRMKIICITYSILKKDMLVETHIDAKQQTQLAMRKRPLTENRLFGETVIYSVLVLFVITGYYLATTPELSIRIANRILADLSFIMMGLSLMLSSLCYFWNFADKYIIYRKHLGLVGFGYLTLHAAISLLASPYTPFAEYYLVDARIMSFAAAAGASIIFIIMALISNRFSIQTIGPKRWKTIMHLGFIAYVLALYHFAVKGLPFWTLWFSGKGNAFPSFGLITFLFGVTVLILRGVLWIATSRRVPDKI